jgi:hypothetical protein
MSAEIFIDSNAFIDQPHSTDQRKHKVAHKIARHALTTGLIDPFRLCGSDGRQ